jgi:hypothetical protein
MIADVLWAICLGTFTVAVCVFTVEVSPQPPLLIWLTIGLTWLVVEAGLLTSPLKGPVTRWLLGTSSLAARWRAERWTTRLSRRFELDG